MENLKEKVIQTLRDSAEGPLKIGDIAHRLDMRGDSRRQLRAAVKELVEAGDLVQTKGRRFGVLENMNLIAGMFLGHRDGFGFVRPLPRPGQVNLPDIYVSGRSVGGAMHGDKVVVRVSGRPDAAKPSKKEAKPLRMRGEVIRILDRGNHNLVGYYEKGDNFSYVVPVDDRIPQHIYVNAADSLDATTGQVVMAEITEYPSARRNPVGKITEVLGERGEPGLDTELLMRKHGIPTEFPPKVLKAAERLPRVISEADLKGRRDLRSLPMVTIDGADAKDFDDAVSIELTNSGAYMLGVHIADVSHYVTPGTALDDEAFNRATSTYLEDRVIPMLPERLSNDLCSLKANEDRLAMSALMEINAKGDLLGHEIVDSVIHVNHRMTYDEVFAILEGDEKETHRYADFVDKLKTMNDLARTLRSRRMAQGSLDFNFPEARAICDSEGEVVDIVLRKHTIAHELIEEFMLKANETVARHVTKSEAPMLYRIHEEPDEEKMATFREFLASLGYQLTEKDSQTPRGLQAICRAAKDKPEESLVSYLLLRSLKEARYSPENAGHFGLACDCYTHFTSPIRRYPDLIAHRIVRTLSRKGAARVREDFGELLDSAAAHCSMREREAMEAERESLDTKQLMFMKTRIGDVFEGRITGVHAYGLFIELVECLAEGLVHVSSLDDDYYAYIEEKHCLLGQHSGRRYRLGDLVHVQVVRVDVERRRMDFVLHDQEGESPKQKKPTAPKPQPKDTAKRPGQRTGQRKKVRRGRSRKR